MCPKHSLTFKEICRAYDVARSSLGAGVGVNASNLSSIVVYCILVLGPFGDHQEIALFFWELLPYRFGDERHEGMEEF